MRATLGSLACFAAALAAQDRVDPARLVAQLGGDGKAAAHVQLVKLGAAAVPALTAGLGAPGDKATVERLRILREIGPPAGSAVPVIRDRFLQVRLEEQFAEWQAAFADLVPFRPDDEVIDPMAVVTAWSRIPAES